MEWFSADDYWFARLLFLRALAAVYLVAFLVAVNQFRALLGTDGMLPIPRFVARVPFSRAPSIFHWHYTDRFFATLVVVGAVLSTLTLVGITEILPLPATMAVWLVLWALYQSIVNVGQTWYSFGWESLLLEVGFLAIFLGDNATAPPFLMLIALRWVLFRLEFGAGMIKIRGDTCWRDLTCLNYHHETQPMPGPFSWYFHHLPAPLHKVEVAGNHITQLIVPFALFLPQPVAGIAAGCMIVTQLWLVISGNFSWLNWMAIVLGLSVLPDGFWRTVFGLQRLENVLLPTTSTPLWWAVLVTAVALLVLVLSWAPAKNLVSQRQAMNASFDRLHLVNTYGAFGSVTKIRWEVVVEGTTDPHPGPETVWLEYGFKGKPGDVHRRPPQFAPYHLRLDWLMWFAALSPGYAEPWFTAFVTRLLAGDRATLRLLRHNPFPDGPPRYVRARLFRYRFTSRAERRATGDWWVRTEQSTFLPPVSLSARTAGHRR
ncbi:lipase maturation factor family protein [Tersicoccus sp. MR15.9]|uniref:lipase maturation factor family protein n=1 Tax=Tersicoccus mangrovi TaxID=3121635 RepID=UPI002FE5926F